ncbi:unnamed protein product [Symbiodinium sp. CCMP2592]|nr:unnamed protein product [Symbiodinium sp. CCMP2592]
MGELFEAHNYLRDLVPEKGFKFLDLGCAPGGFSSYLLEDPRCRMGFGVTLPSTVGGFPMRLRSPNFLLQQGDLFELGPADLVAKEVHICICDAQYMRNEVAWDERYTGVRCRSKQHGVWALLVKQFWLGLTRLLAGGMLIFRFGWRDGPPEDLATVWYKKCTLRLFALLHDLFKQVKDVKSDYFNALQSSFYVCCSGFDRRRFEEREVAKLLGNNFNYLVTTRIGDANQLEILQQVDSIRTKEVDDSITIMLDRIEKLRIINEQSRRWHQRLEDRADDPRAVVMVSPVSEAMKEEDLAAIFSVYGRVKRVDIERAEQKAMVQFALAEHATAAAATLPGTQAFAPGMRIWQGEDVHGWSYAEDAAAAWGHVQVPWEWHAAHAEGLAAATMTSAPDSFHGSGYSPHSQHGSFDGDAWVASPHSRPCGGF